MGALQYLAERGLHAKHLPGDSLEVFPSQALSDEMRQWIRAHKPEILNELKEPRRRWYRITLGGRVICKMIGSHPMTYQEALASARWRWPDAEIER